MKNPIKAKLKLGKPSVGVWAAIGHPYVSEILAGLGFDWILFDMEHGPLSIETIQSMIQSMSFTNECVPIVRVPWNDLVLIKRTLDIGVYGLVIPWVNTRENAVDAVRYCKYPPKGIRGWGPRRAGLRDKEYTKTANEEILIAVQIETETAINNLEEIVSVKGIDVCFLGPYDLTMSLGIFQQWEHPRYKDAVDRIIEACEKWGVTPGKACSEADINESIEQGFKFCTLGSDISFLIKGTTDRIKKVKGWPR